MLPQVYRAISLLSLPQNLPMTPYYKLIDYWMMFSMVMLMVTMLFHTYLNKLVRDAKRRGERGTTTVIIEEGVQNSIREAIR